MKRSTIAAQLYTLRDFTKTPKDLEQTLKKVKAIGYEAVQVSGIGPIEPAQVRQWCDEIGLTICATHTWYGRMQDELDNVIAENKLYNCRYAGLGAIPIEYRKSREGYRTFAKEASEIAKKLAEQGLHFIYHNHHFEFEQFDGQTGLDILLQESDASFGFELDMYWVQAGGASPVDWVRKVQGRMGVIHLKDMAVLEERQVFAEIGEGNLNWDAILKACRETGVEWYVVEQDVCRRDPFESLSISFQNLLQYL